MLDLEPFGLLLHILEEDGKIGRNSIRTLQVLDIVTGVKFLAKVFAHRLNIDDSLWEPDIGLTCVLETDRTQDFELFVLALGVSFFVFFLHFDRFLGLAVCDSLKFFHFFFESSQVHCIVSDGADRLDKSNPHTNTDCTLTLGLVARHSGLVQSQVVVHRFFAEIFELVDELIHSFLRLLALCHLGAHAFLSEAAGLSIGLA